MTTRLEARLRKLEAGASKGWDKMLAHFTDDDLRGCIQVIRASVEHRDTDTILESLTLENPQLPDRLRELRSMPLD